MRTMHQKSPLMRSLFPKQWYADHLSTDVLSAIKNNQ